MLGKLQRGRPRDRGLERASRALARFPELQVQTLGGGAKPGRVAVRHRPRQRDQERPVEQGLPVVGLDRLAALVACGSRPALDRVGPPRAKATAEITSHERMFA